MIIVLFRQYLVNSKTFLHNRQNPKYPLNRRKLQVLGRVQLKQQSRSSTTFRRKQPISFPPSTYQDILTLQCLLSKSTRVAYLFGKMSSSSSDQAEMQIGPILLQVVSGDITKEKTDVIVNSSNEMFTLKSGVSKAILDAAGPNVEMECRQKGLAARTEIIITNPGNLQGCKGIIHIVGKTAPNQIKAAVGAVLQMCEQKNFFSVAFPALGTGQGQANPSQVADAMIDSVVEFVQKKPLTCLKKIRIVIFQSQMLSEFHSSLKKNERSNFPENQSFLDKVTNALASVFFGEESKKNEEFINETNTEFKDEIEPAHFEICGMEQNALDNAVSWIKNIVSNEQAEKIIISRYLYEFSVNEFEELNNLHRSLQIILVLQCNQSQAQIKIYGLVKDVLAAFTKVQEMIDCFQGNEYQRKNEELVKNVVQWQFQDGTHYIPFDSATNLKLEREFSDLSTSTTVEIQNKHFNVDFKNSTANRNGEVIHLKRILKNEGMTNLNFPNHWDDMQKSQCRAVQLQLQSQEYQKVEELFRTTVSHFVILKIERIQNIYLWNNYMIKKQMINEKNPAETKNESCLFHGTPPDTLESINHFGFNRSFAGRNATMYGNGTYFAKNAQYSISYSKPDTHRMRYMYLARVLTGMYCQGQQGMITPLPKNPSNPTDLFDSAVDNVSNPSMFLIFNDIQAYPEYLITFK
ncbi:protein mono-ADP-ribosyltransferase PARP14-like isoform X2 [Narcine bancroftii]|uniref:protein mono-ADP-ribosyltransferase PARP14-like isoform X2 n=1 Tax=Narcine bancroftii TaxID=1343680 RepID=UPI0038322712